MTAWRKNGGVRTARHASAKNASPSVFLKAEYEILTAKADDAGLSPGAYMRACALGSTGPRARRSPTVDRELAARAIAELNKAGSNLNQIAHALNIGFQPEREEVEQSAAAVKQAALQILQAFGYKTHVL